jgi:MOSC domain-containing protein
MTATVAWISFTPVKGLRLQDLPEAHLTEDGIPGDRAFFLVDGGFMVSATRLGPLVAVEPVYDADAGTLALRFPDGEGVAGPVELGGFEPVGFYDETLRAQPVDGPFAAALSEHCGRPLRLFAAPAERPGVDRGREGAATLLSLASLERLRLEAGAGSPVDQRRFRMTFGVEGIDAHEEDSWVGHRLRVGEAVLEVAGHVGRCALTTRQPETGVVDFKTLHVLRAYRDSVESSEPLPFGVHARVVAAGRVRVGDPIALAG